MRVITSYSIHYTKLYDTLIAFTGGIDQPADRQGELADRAYFYWNLIGCPAHTAAFDFQNRLDVITSYSIHYTKLYEPNARWADIRFCARYRWRRSARFPGSTWAITCANAPASPTSANTRRCGSCRGRITSYNVCYTKLLRAQNAIVAQQIDPHGFQRRHYDGPRRTKQIEKSRHSFSAYASRLV